MGSLARWLPFSNNSEVSPVGWAFFHAVILTQVLPCFFFFWIRITPLGQYYCHQYLQIKQIKIEFCRSVWLGQDLTVARCMRGKLRILYLKFLSISVFLAFLKLFSSSRGKQVGLLGSWKLFRHNLCWHFPGSWALRYLNPLPWLLGPLSLLQSPLTWVLYVAFPTGSEIFASLMCKIINSFYLIAVQQQMQFRLP